MIFEKKGTTTIISEENSSLTTFLKNLEKEYSKISKDNIIISLFSFGELSASNVLEFIKLSDIHRKNGKSFVLVSEKVSYEDVPDTITMVPTRREAHDIIEMEEIERDLGL